MPASPTAQFKLLKPKAKKTKEEEEEGKTPSVADVNAAMKAKNITPEEAYGLNPNAGFKPSKTNVNKALRTKNITSEEAYGLNSDAGFTPTRIDVKKALKAKKITKEEAYDLNKDYDKKPTPRAPKNNSNPNQSPGIDPNAAPKSGPGNTSTATASAPPDSVKPTITPASKNKDADRKNEKGTKPFPKPTFYPDNPNNGFTGYTPRKTGTGGYDEALKSGAIDKETYYSYLEEAKKPGKDYMPKQASNAIDDLVKERNNQKPNAKIKNTNPTSREDDGADASEADVSEAVLGGHIAPYQGVHLSASYGQSLAKNLMENNNRIMNMGPQFRVASNFVHPDDESAGGSTAPTNYVKPTVTPTTLPGTNITAPNSGSTETTDKKSGTPIQTNKDIPRQWQQNG